MTGFCTLTTAWVPTAVVSRRFRRQSVLSYERESDVWTLALARARADWQHRGMSGRNRHVLTAGVTDFSLRRLPKSTTVDRPKGKTP